MLKCRYELSRDFNANEQSQGRGRVMKRLEFLIYLLLKIGSYHQVIEDFMKADSTHGHILPTCDTGDMLSFKRLDPALRCIQRVQKKRLQHKKDVLYQ
jgi:hypothetical protein